MAGKDYAQVDDAQIREWLQQGLTVAEMVRRAGSNRGTIDHRIRRMKLRAEAPGEGEEIASAIAPRITSLAELLAQSKTDLTKWTVERHVVNKWEVGAKHPATGKILTEPLWQIKAWLKPVQRDVRLAHEVWREMLADWGKRPRPAVAARKSTGSLLAEYDPFDLHLGKLAYAPETGQHYDLKLAAQAFRACRDELLGMTAGLPVEEALLPLGNDYFHYDNLALTTTGGTAQDSDTRFPKMFTQGIELAVETIELLAKRSRVTVKIVPGNHDRQSAFTLGCVLEAEFRKDKRVTIDNAPTLRKYHRYGVNLLGFTHGSEEKQQDLAVIMATEQSEAWAQTVHREWHVGHIHKMKGMFGDSIRGVRIRVMPSISATDAWHASRGYQDRRTMEAYLFHRERGYAGHFSSNVSETLESAA